MSSPITSRIDLQAEKLRFAAKNGSSFPLSVGFYCEFPLKHESEHFDGTNPF